MNLAAGTRCLVRSDEGFTAAQLAMWPSVPLFVRPRGETMTFMVVGFRKAPYFEVMVL
ncbi:MAG TPA: hypothetical protein VIG24_18235 [Acidimicrobiia bacterium]